MRTDPVKKNIDAYKKKAQDSIKRKTAIFFVFIVIYFFFIKLLFL